MNLDIDRLHDCIDKIKGSESIERQIGVTTAYKYLMLDEVLGGGPYNQYVYISHNLIHARQVALEFAEMINQPNQPIYDINIIYNGGAVIVCVNHQSYSFIGHITATDDTDYPAFWRGRNIDRVFVDYRLYNLPKAIKALIYSQGADIV